MSTSPIPRGPTPITWLELFNAIPEVATCHREYSDLYNELSAELLTKYQVTVCPNAYDTITYIHSFVKRTRLSTENLNATFYRSWGDVISKSETELKTEQISHFCSRFVELLHHKFDVPAYKVPLNIEEPEEGWKVQQIGVASVDKMIDQSLMLLRGGTALTRESISNVLLSCIDDQKFNRAEMRNRDVRRDILLKTHHEGSGRSFKDVKPETIIKLVLRRCGLKFPIVKNRLTVRLIQQSNCDVSRTFESYGVDKLATIFQRYKVFFLALKKANKANCKIINRISKRSKTLHVPMPSNPLNSVCVRPIDIDRDARWLNSATISAKLRALNSCKLAMVEQNGFRYNIRNGKSWAKDHIRPPMEAAAVNFNILLDDLRASLGAKFAGKVIYIPSGIEYGLPISDLQMAGNIPFGTRFTVPTSQSLAVGIHWKPEYGCKLLDLSGWCDDNHTIIWHGGFKHKSFYHSGDMGYSSGEHGATEYILAEGRSGEVNESIRLRASSRVGSTDWQCDIIIGTVDDITQKYMMHPNNRIASFRYHAVKQRCEIGYITRSSEETTFFLAPAARLSGRSWISLYDIKPWNNNAQHMLKQGITLNSFLELLGARVVHVRDARVDIDLGLDRISKDVLNMFYC